MASRGLLSLFLLSHLFFVIISPSTSADVRISDSNSQKVSLALYYETLCPYCSKFIVNHLVKIFENGLISIIDLNLVPYGNAKIGSNNTITCQHGSYECLLNTVEACAIHVWPDLNTHFPFIYCVESLVVENKYTDWESCFEKLGLDSKPVADCYNRGYGQQLELQYAEETNALQPPHTYVPWVVVDGQPLYDDYEYFITFVCKAYKGTPLPEACKEPTLQIIPKEQANDIHHVCFAEKATSSSSSSSSSTTATTKIRSSLTSWRRQMKMASSV